MPFGLKREDGGAKGKKKDRTGRLRPMAEADSQTEEAEGKKWKPDQTCGAKYIATELNMYRN